MDYLSKFKTAGKSKVVKGSITFPESSGLRFVLSFTNLGGKLESPLLGLFDKKWRRVREDMRGWYVNKTGAYKLGAINNTAVQSDVWVIHMLCQKEDLSVDSAGLKECLKKVLASAKSEKANIHISSLLLDLAPELAELSKEYFLENGISVYFYEES